VTSSRDLFGNFERMRREIDELFGDVFERSTGLRGAGFSPAEAQGRLYQQIEVEHGPFRRVVELGADVIPEEAKASYDDGMLQVEVPLAPPDQSTRRVPIEEGQQE
jgi:HSP20 family protein